MASRIVARIADALAARGIDADATCARLGIAPEIVRDVDGEVDAEAYAALWGEAVALAGDPWLPLDVARHASASQNLLRFVCLASATLGEGLARASRFLPLVTDTVAWSMVIEDDVARFTSERHRPAAANDVSADLFFLAENVTLARLATGSAALAPREIRLAPSAPADPTPLRVFFRAPVVCEAGRTELVFDRRALDLPLVGADASVVAFFEAYAQKRLEERTASTRLSGEVAAMLHEPGGAGASLVEIAARVGTSTRTLRRRLEAEGTSFQQLVDHERRESSARLLLEGTSSLDEIAARLGFADTSTFQRAFRRWHGVPPQRYASEERLRRARAG